MSFTAPSRGQTVLHTHITQFGNYFTGTNGQEVLRAGNSSTTYADSLTQIDPTQGLITRFGYGALGSQTWVIDATKSRTIIRNLWDYGGLVHDIRAYGAVRATGIDGGTGDWAGTDNTAAIQAAIDAAKAGSVPGSVYIPQGTWMTGPLDGTGIQSGIRIFGDGAAISKLMPTSSCNSAAVLDLCGSGAMLLQDFGIGDTATPSMSGTCAILLANIDGAGSASNAHEFRNLGIDGFYTVASIYGCAVVSSHFISCRVQNHYDGTGTPALYLSGSNAASVTSDWVTLAATGGVNDLTFTGCEFHDSSKQTAVSSSNNAVRIETSDYIRFFGGNCGGNGPALVRFAGACSRILFQGTNLYAQDPSGVTPTHSFSIDSGGSVASMAVMGCRLDSTGGAFGGASGTSYTRLFTRANKNEGSATALVSFTTSGTLTDPDLECLGLAVNCGTGSITRGILYNPGTVTASGGDSSARLGGGTLTLSNGNLSMGNGAVIGKTGAAGTPTYTFAGDQTKGMYDSGTNLVGFSVNSTKRLELSTGGAAVTGTLTVTSTVSGSAGIFGTNPATSGALRIPRNDGLKFLNGSSAVANLISSDGSDNVSVGQIGSGIGDLYVMTPGRMNFYGGGSVRFQANGTGVGFNGATPVAPPAYTVTNPTTNRSIDVTTITLANLAQVVGTMIRDLKPAATGGNGLFA